MVPDSFNEGSSALNDDGNRYVAMLNENDHDRILNDNWVDNDLNSDNRVLLVSQSLCVKAARYPSSRFLFNFAFAIRRSYSRYRLVVRALLQTSYDRALLFPMRFE